MPKFPSARDKERASPEAISLQHLLGAGHQDSNAGTSSSSRLQLEQPGHQDSNAGTSSSSRLQLEHPRHQDSNAGTSSSSRLQLEQPRHQDSNAGASSSSRLQLEQPRHQESNAGTCSSSRLQLEQRPVDDPLPSSPTTEDQFFIWPSYLEHSNDGETGSSSSRPSTSNTSDLDGSSDFEGAVKKEPVKLIKQEIVAKLVENGAFLTCWNDEGQTPLHVCVERKLKHNLETLIKKAGPDVKDRNGKTVLRAAVDAYWLPGVRVALNAGADLTLKAPDGETSLHAAAAAVTAHNKDELKPIIHELLIVAKQKNVVNCLNAKNETALFHAVRRGHICVVEQFLDNGATTKYTTENNLSVFHLAAKHEHDEILKKLLDFDEATTMRLINRLTTPNLEGFAPIHFAVSSNSLACVRRLIYKNADLCVKSTNVHGSTTPLHMAIDYSYYEIAENILCSEAFRHICTPNKPHVYTVKQFDGKGMLPLHAAIQKGSEKFIKLLLKYNASLVAETQCEKRKTALDMIMKHVTNPTEFLEEVLHSYISYTPLLTVDYNILMPSKGLKEETDVIMALLKTGNEFNQKRLLLHPLIESFIYLKWWALRRYYFAIAAIYLIFLICLATFATTVYYNMDKNKKTEWSYFLSMGCVIIFLIVLIILQELLMNVEGIRYFLKPENWVKLGSIGLAIVVSIALMVQPWEKDEWPRHVATVALLLSCMQMLNILSQFPKWGYYVVMFKKVTFTVIKILATFAILIIGFALSFMIQFRSQIPFDGFWHAIVKTLFLLTSEFEYNNVFEEKNAETLGSSFEAARVLFIVFLFLAAIVLMNMMVGVAVDDITGLKSKGKSGRLEKQAGFVRSLDTLKYNLTKVILPERYRRQVFPRKIIIEKKTEKIKIFDQIREIIANDLKLPKRFQDALFSIAQKNHDEDISKKIRDKELEDEKIKSETESKFYENTTTRLNKLESVTTDNASQIQDVNRKLDLLREDFLHIKQFLMSLTENKEN